MLEFENTIVVDRPRDQVFDFLADYRNMPKWNYFVLEVQPTSNSSVGTGATYRQIRKTDEQHLRVAEYDRPRRVVIESLPGSNPQVEMQFTLQADGLQTKITDKWRLDTGKPSFVEWAAGGQVKRAVAENLAKLKVLLENGRVVLQDGRVATLS